MSLVIPMYNTAIIIGGSISGLLSAHVLAPHCARVVIVDKDDLRAPPRVSDTEVPDRTSMAWRRGVPQVCQPHQLTAGGALALDTLLPGFHEQVVEMGGIDLDLAKHVYYFDHRGKYPTFQSRLRGLGVSRPFLEQCVRDRVYFEDGDKISVIRDTLVDFETNPGDGAIAGVHLRDRGFVPCDLYIDASGRSSILPALLEKHGIGNPEKIAVDAKIKSASRFVKIPESFEEEWKLLVIKSLPSGTKGGSLLPMEGGVWQVTLADAGGEPISLTDEGFLGFAETLPDKKLHEILRVALPLTEVIEYKAMRNEKLLYDGLNLPAGLLPIGDSVQRLNPIYGQGITVAAQSAITLSHCLEDALRENINNEDFCKIYIRELYRSLENSWQMAIASDIRFPSTTVSDNLAHTKSSQASAFDRFVADSLLKWAQKDPKLYMKLLEVAHFTRPAKALTKDGYVWVALLRAIAFRWLRSL